MSISAGEPSEVEEVAPGIFRLKLPIGNPWLRFTFAYLMTGDGESVLFDAGQDLPECLDTFMENLPKTGAKVGDIKKVVISHLHSDHYGLAEKIRAVSGAKVIYHEVERWNWEGNISGDMDRQEWLRINGVPKDETAANERLGPRFPNQGAPAADVKVRDGETLKLAGRSYDVIWTPGHAAGHICLYDREAGVMFSGDHVLPFITPNVSAYNPGTDPLGDYLRSLRKVLPLRPNLVLPGHEFTFDGLDLRVRQIQMHHAERFEQVMHGTEGGPHTGYEVASKVTWNVGSWQNMSAGTRHMALGETVAHLRHLEVLGHVSSMQRDGRTLYVLNQGKGN